MVHESRPFGGPESVGLGALKYMIMGLGSCWQQGQSDEVTLPSMVKEGQVGGPLSIC